MGPKRKNYVVFENCNFINNSANGGAAMDIRPDNALQHGAIFITGVTFTNVTFDANTPKQWCNDELTEQAVFLTSEVTVEFFW